MELIIGLHTLPVFGTLLTWEGRGCRNKGGVIKTDLCSLVSPQGIHIRISLSSVGTKVPTQNEGGNSRLSTRFLGHHPVTSVQFSSVAQSCPTLCNPMNHSMPLPVHHQLPEFTQAHVHQVSDAIQPSHPLSSPSPPAPNPSQHQSLFQ